MATKTKIFEIILIVILICVGYGLNDLIHPIKINNVCEYSEQQIKNQKTIIDEQKNLSLQYDQIIRDNKILKNNMRIK